MLHKWYESTDVMGNFVKVIFLDYSKAFDLINHGILLNKIVGMEVPAHLVRWIAAFLLDSEHRVERHSRNVRVTKNTVLRCILRVITVNAERSSVSRFIELPDGKVRGCGI